MATDEPGLQTKNVLPLAIPITCIVVDQRRPCLLQVKAVNGSSILRLLKGLGLAPEIPEDLYHLIKKAVSMRKHLELFRKDKDGKFRLILVESRIHRLARYYRVRPASTPQYAVLTAAPQRKVVWKRCSCCRAHDCCHPVVDFAIGLVRGDMGHLCVPFARCSSPSCSSRGVCKHVCSRWQPCVLCCCFNFVRMSLSTE